MIRLLAGICLGLVAVLAALVLSILATTPNVVVSLQARSEIVRARTDFDQGGDFTLLKGRLGPPGTAISAMDCVAGVLRVGAETSVSILRAGRGPAYVSLKSAKAPLAFEALGQEAKAIGRDVVIVLDPADTACPGNVETVIPIAGRAVIGGGWSRIADYSGTPDDLGRAPLLLGGQIITYIKSSQPSWLEGWFPSRLYRAETIELPPGWALGPDPRSPAPEGRVTWQGLIRLAEDGALAVSVQVNDPWVRIYRSGTPELTTRDATAAPEGDAVAVTALSRLTGDPFLVGVQLFIGLLLALSAAMSGIASALKPR